VDLAVLSRLLVVNPGSSSLKLRVLGPDDTVALEEDLRAQEGKAELRTLRAFLERAGELDACGVRVVHGGPDFQAAVRVDDEVLERLDRVSELAPLHNPPALAAVRELQQLRPGLPIVACFDTAFHARLPAEAATYAVPARWRDWGARRYGFHGLSHAYASRRAAELTGARQMVTCHLGAGASLAAVEDGVSIDTTMGFTPMEGLVMATRSGSIDPGMIIWLQRRHRLTVGQVERALDHESGILGLAGTADMKKVLEAASQGDSNARLAAGVYVHRLRALIAAMAASLGGLDALVFTGGIGENAASIRSQTCAGLGFLGVELDESRNRSADDDAEIGKKGAAVRVLVVKAREDLEIAREVRAILR
jgi:acetate kinase